jgi:hypothetical protein
MTAVSLPLIEVLQDVLADIDRDLRAEHGALFEHVDTILANPDRHVNERTGPYITTSNRLRWLECPWCGDNFVSDGTTCCSSSCGARYRRWQDGRKRPATPIT